MKPLGLYVHVPFCARKCAYCDFPSYEGAMAQRGPYVEALTREIHQRGEAAGRPEADSVYIGGGTPSLLQPEQIAAVLAALKGSFRLSPDCEISCEANPGALSARFLSALARGGVKRLSLGAQERDPALLKTLGRRHTWVEVEEAAAAAGEAGIRNINLDLMLGIPGQTLAGWRDTLEAALALPVRHLSCYGLIVEEGTPLQRDIASGVLQLPEEEEERAMYDLTLERLAEAGFQQYEISNFARPGARCRHNLNCWRREDYLGFGAAAHSLEGGDTRRMNPEAIQDYLAGAPATFERLSPEERRFESLMLGLRLREGLDLAAFQSMHGLSFRQAYGAHAIPGVEKGLSEFTAEGYFRLTRRGMDVMNAVLLDFM